MSLLRHQRNLILEGVCLAVIWISLIPALVLTLCLLGAADSRIPRANPADSKLASLHLEPAKLREVLEYSIAGTGFCILTSFAIRRALVRPERPPWEGEV